MVIHALDTALTDALNGRPVQIPQQINATTLKRAIYLVDVLSRQTREYVKVGVLHTF